MPNGLISRKSIHDDAASGSSTSYTCTHCGCLCDDLELVLSEGRVVEARSACETARPRLVGLSTTPAASPSPRVQGREVGREQAVTEAARILAGSRAALVMGFRRSTNETVRTGVALADRIGATIEVGDEAASWPRLAAMQRVGSVGATLGEVKNRADVVVFWCADPMTTNPRHGERYSADVEGRFVPEGRSGRRVVVVDERPTATAGGADVFLKVRPEAELNVLLVLRALVREVPVDAHRVEEATGCSLADLQGLAELLQGARYGAWFSGGLAGRGPIAEAESRHQTVTGLIRELNRKTRFVAVGLGEAGNSHGAESVLAWQSGFAPGVDFGVGFPESLPGESTAAGRLARGEFDAAILVGGPAYDALPEGSRARLATRPWIFLGDRDHEAFELATIALPSATAGIDEAGTFTRVDGVSLPVRALRPASSPTEGEWIDALMEAVGLSGRDAGAPGSEAGR
ncbi:formylmethanofuran dehydrogenase subunit B [Paludisphaera soli]|uniref:formylmethanofuran dehydrogenase subunit B n=1 Tax=Paludisphaera soli TaxID=2712865 RepID=UPI0013EDCC51|nr:formylmethanofuran dehydrogenase subunit B [Paludisphaera soli]